MRHIYKIILAANFCSHFLLCFKWKSHFLKIFAVWTTLIIKRSRSPNETVKSTDEVGKHTSLIPRPCSSAAHLNETPNWKHSLRARACWFYCSNSTPNTRQKRKKRGRGFSEAEVEADLARGRGIFYCPRLWPRRGRGFKIFPRLGLGEASLGPRKTLLIFLWLWGTKSPENILRIVG